MATSGWGRGPWSSAEWGDGVVIELITGSVAITGVAPSIVQGNVITPSVGTLNLTGVAPYLDRDIVSTVGSITITGITPQIVVHNNIFKEPSTGTISLIGGTATISNPNWNTINTSQTPSWGTINTAQTPNWLRIAA